MSARRRCSVRDCPTREGRQKGDVILFAFPPEQLVEYTDDWRKVVDKCDISWRPRKTSKICSLHFSRRDYCRGPKKLHPGAVPKLRPFDLVKEDHCYSLLSVDREALSNGQESALKSQPMTDVENEELHAELTVKKEYEGIVQSTAAYVPHTNTSDIAAYARTSDSVLYINTVHPVQYPNTVDPGPHFSAECTSIKEGVKEDSWSDHVYTTVHILLPDNIKEEVKEEILFSEDPLT